MNLLTWECISKNLCINRYIYIYTYTYIYTHIYIYIYVYIYVYIYTSVCVCLCVFTTFCVISGFDHFENGNHPCFCQRFSPQRRSRSSSPPDTEALSCGNGQSFHESRGYWSQTKIGTIKPSIIGTWESDMRLRWEYMWFCNSACIQVLMY